MSRILIDISEFLAHPMRTGIQRVIGQLCRHWPETSPPTYVKIGPSGSLVELESGLPEAITDFFDSSQDAQAARNDILRLAAAADRRGHRVRLHREDRVLLPEVFYEDSRLSFYEALPDKLFHQTHFLVFDLLPLTRPEYFPGGGADLIARYFRLLRRGEKLAYISRWTQRECCLRLRRNPTNVGPVLPLGSDSFGPKQTARRPQTPPLLVVVGTLEPRKNHDLILDALEDELSGPNPPFHLVFAGRIGCAKPRVIDRIRDLDKRCDAFGLIEDAADGEVQDLMARAWATLAVSDVEGFGLPAVESLWLGVPVIVSHDMPSVEGMDQGVEKLGELSAETIRAAVHRMLDPAYREQKAGEAVTADLPTWRDFAQRCCDWVTGSSIQEQDLEGSSSIRPKFAGSQFQPSGLRDRRTRGR
jgi:glycosyltransferase involved in cell wall biosynthesis